MSTRILIQDITKSYPAIAPAPGSPPTTTAVDRVSLAIEPGELFFLLGPSGCGKTTLLRMIAGFIEPTQGKILFDAGSGSPPTDVTFMPAEKRDTGMVFQSYALWPHMTVAQNVAFGLEVRGIAKDERESRVREALAQVRMQEYAARKPNQLSGGQQQRVALARAIVVKPRVLLLDEPLSNLDARLRVELRAEIRRICKASGITTVYVTHDQKEALSMADRIAIMRAGKLEQLGTPLDLYHRPESRFVAEFLGETNILSGKVLGLDAQSVRIATPVGELVATTDRPWRIEQSVLVSIRHEAIEAGDSASNNILATIDHRTFLGEVWQESLRVDGQHLSRLALAPSPDGGAAKFHVARSRVSVMAAV
jgi:iron(III) transport system ATP-binding protein